MWLVHVTFVLYDVLVYSESLQTIVVFDFITSGAWVDLWLIFQPVTVKSFAILICNDAPWTMIRREHKSDSCYKRY